MNVRVVMLVIATLLVVGLFFKWAEHLHREEIRHREVVLAQTQSQMDWDTSGTWIVSQSKPMITQNRGLVYRYLDILLIDTNNASRRHNFVVEGYDPTYDAWRQVLVNERVTIAARCEIGDIGGVYTYLTPTIVSSQ